MSLHLTINGKPRTVTSDTDTPLLWVLRDELGLTGTKYGCGLGICGACTVHLDGAPVRSCSTAIAEVAGRKVTTIEGLSATGTHPLQNAWIAESVAQCGYCQPGQIMSAAALLKAKKGKLTDADIEDAMSGNLCRCGTYQRVRKAIYRAAAEHARS